MAISGFNTTISELAGSSTFYEWFVKENTEIIAKLNLAKVANVTGGDILASLNSSTGVVTLSLGGTSGIVSSGVTFTGKVSFLGETVLPNVSYKFTGITTGTTGYTFGSVIRITSTGYTLANANSPESAEVVGVISATTPSYSVITLSGQINGDFSQVSGGTLSAGCVYFLSGQTAGYITTTEPSTIGYVSKPIIVGIGATSGIVVQYRGNYLNSSTSDGSSGSNRIYISLSTTPTDPRTRGFSAGSFLSYAPNVISGNTFFQGYLTDTGRTAIDGWFLSGSKNYVYQLYEQGTEYYRLPREEDFIVGMIETVTTSGGNVIYQILTRGTTTIIPKSLLAGNAKGTWLIQGVTYQIGNAGITQLAQQPIRDDTTYASGYQVGIAFQDTPTYWFVNPRPITLPPNVVSLQSTGLASATSNLNYSFNGDMEIWQRTTARDSAYTASGNIYFADAWIRRQSSTGTSIQSIQRQSFSIESVDVEGTPKYYLNVKCLADPSGLSPSSGIYSVGHIFEGINTFNGQSITVSFYAKCAASGILANYPVNVYLSRYSAGSLIEKKTIGQVNITNTTWQKFTLNYNVPNLASSSYSDDYVEIGLDFIPTISAAYTASKATSENIAFSLASMVVYKGTYSSPTHLYDDYNEKLKKCQRFYFSTYTASQTPGSKTMLSVGEPELNTYNFTYTPQSPFSIFKFPVIMKTTPNVTLYSPDTGTSSEVFNYTGGRDLRYLNGTKGYNNQTRFSPSSVSTVATTQDATSVKINLYHGVVPYDVINCHIIADSSYSI